MCGLPAVVSMLGEATSAAPWSGKVEWDVSLTPMLSYGDPLLVGSHLEMLVAKEATSHLGPMPSQDLGDSTSHYPGPWLGGLHRHLLPPLFPGPYSSVCRNRS